MGTFEDEVVRYSSQKEKDCVDSGQWICTRLAGMQDASSTMNRRQVALLAFFFLIRSVYMHNSF